MRLSCAGNALYDIIAFTDTDFTSSMGVHRGSTSHVEPAELETLLAALKYPSGGAGGGAANTARVFTSLGFDAAFAGSIGKDERGSLYRADMMASGVKGYLQERDAPTGVFCAMIEPDGTRTIVVSPGAAPRLDIGAIPGAFFAKNSTLYLDGFLALAEEAVLAMVSRAKAAGMKVALDVAGARIAAAKRDFFVELIRTHCSWSFMNEDEFAALSGSGVDESLKDFSAAAAPGVVVVKRAEVGAVSVSDGSVLESHVRPIQAMDPTGAGDAFAAGFLSAALSGAPLAKCLRLGNRIAEQSIQVPGMLIDGVRLRHAAAGVS